MLLLIPAFFFEPADQLQASSSFVLIRSICSSSQTLYLLYFCAFIHLSPKSTPPPSSPEVCNWEMMDRSASLWVLRHQIGMPGIPRLSDKTHSAQPFLIYIQLHMHMSVLCMYVDRLTYSPMYKQEHDLSLSYTNTHR